MIKYHDNKNGVMYDGNGHLTDNWNPDDFKDSRDYVNVYFRIETNLYHYDRGFATEEDRQTFDREVDKIFTSIGFACHNPHYSGSCATYTRGKAHLYMHPQNFSGEVLKKDVREIAEAIAKTEHLDIRWVDLYETVYDISEDEYIAYLAGKTDAIRKALIEAGKTKRRDYFHRVSDICACIAKRAKLQRVGIEDGDYSGGIGFTSKWIAENVIPQLVSDGYMVKAGEELVRTVNKTEAKKLKLVIA